MTAPPTAKRSRWTSRCSLTRSPLSHRARNSSSTTVCQSKARSPTTSVPSPHVIAAHRDVVERCWAAMLRRHNPAAAQMLLCVMSPASDTDTARADICARPPRDTDGSPIAIVWRIANQQAPSLAITCMVQLQGRLSGALRSSNPGSEGAEFDPIAAKRLTLPAMILHRYPTVSRLPHALKRSVDRWSKRTAAHFRRQ
jgi:hypothetical protein